MTLKNNYIACRLQGRTGNLMFQIAHGFAKSLEYNRQFLVPSRGTDTAHLERGLFRKFNFYIESIPEPNVSTHIWAPFTYELIAAPENDKPTVYAGWYQSEKYFGRYGQIIRDAFSPTKDFVQKASTDFPWLQKSIVAAINIRRGDYLTFPTRHPVVSLEYINEAIKRLPPHDYLIVLSDDFKWCKENIEGNNIVFPETYFDQDAMWLLSLCDHFIISNSTFSWWGAYLSQNLNKVVISPSTWFGPDVGEDPRDVWCENWIKIDTKWEAGVIKLR